MRPRAVRHIWIFMALTVITMSGAGTAWSDRGNQAELVREAIVRDLAPTGQIRFCSSSRILSRDPATREVRGVSVDIAREVGARLAVEAVLTDYPADEDRNRAFVGGECDVIITDVTTGPLGLVDLTPPLLVVDLTLLVRGSSSMRSMADVDQSGMRVTAGGGGAMTRALSQQLSYAELIRTGSFEEAFELLVADAVDAVAGNRAVALDLADRLPGSRVLEDRFGAFLFALGVSRGRPVGLAYLTAFAEEAKGSGFLAASLERYGTRGLSVAPPTEPLVR